eukprot:g29475.t1
MARLLATPGSVPPLPGPNSSMDGMPLNPLWRPPLELLFVELHEEAPVARSVSDLGATIRMERFVPYFLEKFKGKPTYPGKNNMYILFPDYGAYSRYATSVRERLKTENEKSTHFNGSKESVGTCRLEAIAIRHCQKGISMNSSMDMEDHILIIDDFTNSGGTLFGAVKLVKMYAGGSEQINVSIFVSHLVATYDPKTVEGLKEKLHELGKH